MIVEEYGQGWMNRRVEGQMDGWMEEWMDG